MSKLQLGRQSCIYYDSNDFRVWLQSSINVRPASPNTSWDKCCATSCSAVGPPKDSASMLERMLWRHVRARDCTRCILERTFTPVMNQFTILYSDLSTILGEVRGRVTSL